MKLQYRPSATVPLLIASIVGLASCTTEPKPAPTAAQPSVQSGMTTTPGEAGRYEEDVFRAQTVVSAVDMATRRVTLTGPEGRQYTFTAGP